MNSFSPELLYTGVALLGLIIGSFLNVVIYRLSIQQNLYWPRSNCPLCHHPISILDNIPILSYLILRGRCRACHGHISWRYPLVEGLTAILSVFVVWVLGHEWQAVFALFFVWGLIALTFIDFDKQILPDTLTLPLLWLGLVINCFSGFVTPQDAILGAAMGYLSLWSVYWIFKLLTQKEGMGYGDFKLLAAIGAWLGWQVLPLVILMASLLGCIVGFAGILCYGRDKNVPIPFGPYLAIASFIALLWGKTMIDWYVRYAF